MAEFVTWLDRRPGGTVGDIASDDSYIYAKTSTGWKRAAP